ncbi:LuxR C-terminal-related transcriptional regulator [Primorskyibacter flagellatus]|jgi:DNA-binding NarL/FixJ family response regulator|uniref:LuxR C-terminal-related transcriptional regulator n=1 Tax=Primorskyibacter flagellatus TaxID=1387277 RepID=UPI003A93116F
MAALRSKGTRNWLGRPGQSLGGSLTFTRLAKDGIGGLALLPQLQDRAAGVPVLVFTMNENPSLARMAMEQGALGFLSKNAPPEQFLLAERTVMAGPTFLEARLALSLVTDARTEDRFSDLNPREAQVLRLIAQGRSYDEIAGSIHVSYRTVANVIAALRRKQSVRNLTELMRIGLEMDGTAPRQLARSQDRSSPCSMANRIRSFSPFASSFFFSIELVLAAVL